MILDNALDKQLGDKIMDVFTKKFLDKKKLNKSWIHKNSNLKEQYENSHFYPTG